MSDSILWAVAVRLFGNVVAWTIVTSVDSCHLAPVAWLRKSVQCGVFDVILGVGSLDK
jgi:hypothetical protein